MKKLDKKQTSPVLQKKSAPLTKKDVSYKSDMIGMPGSSTRKKVDKEMKGKKVDSPVKMVKEKSPLRQAKSTIDSAMREKKNSPTKMKKC
jgi:hypothetical protein